jgi:hypothetical protein
MSHVPWQPTKRRRKLQQLSSLVDNERSNGATDNMIVDAIGAANATAITTTARAAYRSSDSASKASKTAHPAKIRSELTTINRPSTAAAAPIHSKEETSQSDSNLSSSRPVRSRLMPPCVNAIRAPAAPKVKPIQTIDLSRDDDERDIIDVSDSNDSFSSPDIEISNGAVRPKSSITKQTPRNWAPQAAFERLLQQEMAQRRQDRIKANKKRKHAATLQHDNSNNNEKAINHANQSNRDYSVNQDPTSSKPEPKIHSDDIAIINKQELNSVLLSPSIADRIAASDLFDAQS